MLWRINACGRGNIKRFIIFSIIVLNLLIINIFIHSQDQTDDTSKKTETEYFDKVKSSMSKGSKDTKVQNEVEENKSNNKKKNNISINYFSYIKIIAVLTLVIIIIYLLSLILKRLLKIRGVDGDAADVIINQSLGPGKWLQVVHLAGKFLVLGVTNDQVNLLTEVTDPNEIERYEIIMNQKRVETGGNFIDVISDFFRTKLKNPFAKKKFDYEEDSVEFLKKQNERIDKLNGK